MNEEKQSNKLDENGNSNENQIKQIIDQVSQSLTLNDQINSEAVNGRDSSSNQVSSSSSSSSSDLTDIRIAVVGNVDSGKSTLIGVLTSGKLDDGRGLARSCIFIHPHEHETGRTSAISQHIMGFNEKNQPIHQTAPAKAGTAAKTKSWTNVVQQSKTVVTFVDLAGKD